MSKYTTGEAARLCGVSVRTVQYYDTRGLLTPSELSQGGRRLYTDGDLRRLRIICFLRELGLSLGSIGEILRADNRVHIVSLLLEQQAQALREELAEREGQLERVRLIQQELKGFDSLTVENLTDIVRVMENKRKLRRVHIAMILTGIVMDGIEIGTAIYWGCTGHWQPFAVGMAVVAALGVGIVRYAHRRMAYICPECHSVFRPRVGEMLLAAHTLRTRRLKCPQCGYAGFCVETHADAMESN